MSTSDELSEDDLSNLHGLLSSREPADLSMGLHLLGALPEQAQKSYFSRYPEDLRLDCMQDLPSPEGLRHHNGNLWLNGLEHLEPDAAVVLGSKRGNLGLNGLKELNPEIASLLAGHKGSLFLDGLKSVSPATLSALGPHRGCVFLRGIAYLGYPELTVLRDLGTRFVVGTMEELTESSRSLLISLPGYKGKIPSASQEDFTALSERLEIRSGLLAGLCSSKSKRPLYKTFSLRKRSGGSRTIHSPLQPLDLVQKRIKERILDPADLHSECVTAFRTGISIVNNALPHCGKQIVVKMDLKDFFPSVTFGMVMGVFRRLGLSGGEARQLALLTTTSQSAKKGRAKNDSHKCRRFLPQGASTSPQLANFAARRLDLRLLRLSECLGFRFTRYADDMTFSSEDPMAKVNVLIRAVGSIAPDCGFVVNAEKTRVMRSPGTRRVTGLILGNEPRVPRKTMRKIRSMIHRKMTGGNFAGIHVLEGYRSYVRMINQAQSAKLDALDQSGLRDSP